MDTTDWRSAKRPARNAPPPAPLRHKAFARFRRPLPAVAAVRPTEPDKTCAAAPRAKRLKLADTPPPISPEPELVAFAECVADKARDDATEAGIEPERGEPPTSDAPMPVVEEAAVELECGDSPPCSPPASPTPSDDLHTAWDELVTCQCCGHVWDGFAQCPCE